MRDRIVHLRMMIVLALAVAALSCTEAAPPAQTEETSVENVELGIRLAAVPEGLAISVNQGGDLELRPTTEGIEGVISFAVGPEQHSVNLVAAVQEHQTRIEALTDGTYMGAQELSGDFGAAFYSRGRFTQEGAAVEETVLLLIHPAAYRLLEITYRYPAAGDSAARVEQLIEVLSELE